MSILDKLASALGRRDEVPNQELAQQLIMSSDKNAIKLLVENLKNRDKHIQSDCIKVLYEIGEHEPKLIAPYANDFINLLKSKNNRLVWGAMTALDGIASVNPKDIYDNLAAILDAADKGSVITKDHGVSILIKLAAIKDYTTDALVLLLDTLKGCATNQLPMYAESAAPVVIETHKKDYVKVLTSRLGDIEKESKRKRVEKVIRRLEK